MSRPTTPAPTFPITTASSHHQFTSPPRSTTLPSKPTTTKHHHHHHPHRSHHREKSIPQTAIERTTAHPFGELLRLDRPHHRRRGSNGSPPHPQPLQSHPHNSTGESTSDLDGTHERQRQEVALGERQAAEQRRNQRWAEVSRLRLSRQEGEQELKQTLRHLSDLSTKMTRRLDYTYFALLTSLSQLTSSVNAFLALAKESRRAQEGFGAGAAELERETRASVKGTNEVLDRQVDRIGALQGRMKRASERVERLGGRLERVRDKVGEAEERDGEGEKRSGRRITMLWSFLGTWACVILVALVLKHSGSLQPTGPSNTSQLLDDTLSDLAATNSSLEHSASTDYVSIETARPSGGSREERECTVDADATMRLFDNL